MKKLCLMLLALCLGLPVLAHADVEIRSNGSQVGQFEILDLSPAMAVSRKANSMAAVISVAGGGASIASATATLPLTYVTISIVTDGVAASLPNGTYNGQMLQINVIAQNSGQSKVITPVTCTGFSTITMSSTKQAITLQWVAGNNPNGWPVGWIIIGNAGATIG